MLDLNDLPAVSDGQMALMNQKAEKLMAAKQGRQQEQVNYFQPPVEEQPAFQQEMVENEPIQEQSMVENEDNDLDQPVKEETKREYNTRMLREAKEAAERERDEWRRMAMAAQQPQEQKRHVEVEEDYFKGTDLSDDALVEGRHYKEMAKRERERELRLQRIEQNYQEEIKNIKVKSSMPDFEEVCSNANFAELRRLNPVLAQTIYEMPDGYKKQELAYTMVKQLGIVKTNTNKRVTSDKDVAVFNASKPKPVASISPQHHESALGKANSFGSGVTKEMKQKWLREMIESERAS